MNDSLRDVQKEFPRFAIWREVSQNRTRYHARRVGTGVHPHTVVTADLAELRSILRQASSDLPPAIDCQCGERATPSVARMYSYWTGGKDYLAADRAAALKVSAGFPEVAAIAHANRQFVTRAVTYVTQQGITQFLDIGAGLPAWPAVHQIAQQHTRTARTVYIDNDEVVLAHARALLATGPGVTAAHGDLRDPAGILSSPIVSTVLDFGRPICLILAAVLHFLEPDEADHAVASLTATLAPGSYLVISAGTSTGTDPALIDRLRIAYAGTSTVSARPQAGIEAWFAGFGLLPPGLTDVRDWRPARTRPGPARKRTTARFLAGIGHKLIPSL